MRIAVMYVSLLAVIVLAVGSKAQEAANADEPKHKIKDVMKKCMAGGLCKKVASGKANDAKQKELLVMFQSLAANKPPRGDETSWNEKTKSLVDGAQAVVDGKEGAGGQLQKAAPIAKRVTTITKAKARARRESRRGRLIARGWSGFRRLRPTV